ncbi:MAG: hypothetical protein ACI9KE_004599, partial [Polyangiales bacterium]
MPLNAAADAAAIRDPPCIELFKGPNAIRYGSLSSTTSSICPNQAGVNQPDASRLLVPRDHSSKHGDVVSASLSAGRDVHRHALSRLLKTKDEVERFDAEPVISCDEFFEASEEGLDPRAWSDVREKVSPDDALLVEPHQTGFRVVVLNYVPRAV